MDAQAAAILHMDAWNGNDPARVAATADRFDAPGTEGPVSGQELRAHAAALFEAFPGLKFGIDAQAAGPDHVVLSWTLHVQHLGRYLGARPSGATATISGTDVVRCDGDQVRVLRAFDRVSLLDRLGIRVVVSPPEMHGWRYGLGSRLAGAGAERPGVLVMTRLDVADEQQEEQVSMLSLAVGASLRNARGFLGATTTIVGGHIYTMSAFDRPESVRAVNMKPHQRAVRRFYRSGLCTAGTVSVWSPVRLMEAVRCPACGVLSEDRTGTGFERGCACEWTPRGRPFL
ncbi:hypothetical protein E1295_26090 [Nonomuraea mesophila]|uniref:Ester cyclase n=1 Tax=Nonomuraea mesophila TaxID=2530382 RepID=A0A4R5F701_9ACTN|nr:ester cyclase [Nonomuraea mesophila]TDE43684.1 hypothetical protein E1295_26090 [Nonomuraea mesophila]